MPSRFDFSPIKASPPFSDYSSPQRAPAFVAEKLCVLAIVTHQKILPAVIVEIADGEAAHPTRGARKSGPGVR